MGIKERIGRENLGVINKRTKEGEDIMEEREIRLENKRGRDAFQRIDCKGRRGEDFKNRVIL